MKDIDLNKLKEAADNFRTMLAAHRQNPRNYEALDAWDRASGVFAELVNNDELNIIAVLIDKLVVAEGQRAGAFLACNRWHDKFRDAEKKLEAAQLAMEAVVKAASLRGIRPFEGIECDPPTLLENAEACGDAMSARISDLERNPPMPHHNGMMQLSQRVAEVEAQLEAAQRERDNWRVSFDNERYRADKLLAEIKRRDAQEPVADVVLWEHPTEERKCDIRWRRHDVQPGPLYAAATAAVLPPEICTTQAIHRLEVEDSPGTVNVAYKWGYNQAIADAKAMGCQPEKVVKLPELCVGVVQRGHAVMVPYAAGHWFNKTAILEALAVAGVKVEGE